MARLKKNAFREDLRRLIGFRARPIFRDVQRLTSFTEDITRAGMIPGARTLRMRLVRRGPVVRALGEPSLLELVRLRYADGDPVCLEVTFLPSRYEEILDEADLGGSLYRILKENGEKLAGSRELLAVRSPNQEERKLLGIRGRMPIVQIARLALDRSGAPLEFTRNVLRADRYLFYFELKSR